MRPTCVYRLYPRRGLAEQAVADAAYAFKLAGYDDPVSAAPLMCAGLIGWRSLAAAGDGRSIGIYGFGAAAHIIAQVCRWQGRDVYAFTRAGDERHRPSPGSWAQYGPGAPMTILRFVSMRLSSSLRSEPGPDRAEAVRKGGRVVCGGIHMSDIPSFP